MQKDFVDNGFVLVKNIFTQNDVNNLLKLINEYIEKHKHKFEIYEVNYTKEEHINSVHCLHKYDSTIIEYVKKNVKFMDTINNLLDSEVDIVVSEAFLKPAGEGMSSPIHQDNNLWCLKKGDAFTAWIALDHIDDRNGGLKLFKNSHKLGPLEHTESFAAGTSQTVNENEYYKFDGKDNYIINTLKPGDVQFHHSLMIHGSNVNLSTRSRRVLTIQVFSKKDSRCPILWEKYRQSVIKQNILNKGLTVSLINNTISFEDTYKYIEDPWTQLDKLNVEKFSLINFFVSYLLKNKKCNKFLELGSGLGKVVLNLKKDYPNINIIGSDISITCINKVNKKYKDLNFIRLDICDKKDQQHILNLNPDVFIFSDITWFLLNYLNDIKAYIKQNFKGKYIIHTVNMYPDPKYGNEYFKTHQEILSYFNFKYIYEGNCWINNSQNSYFLALI